MITIIVPVDFTPTSDNAAIYAANIARQLNGRVILFHIYEKIPAGIDGTPLVNDPEARNEIRMMALDKLKNNILLLTPDIDISCVAEPGNDLLKHTEELITRSGGSLVVMGVAQYNDAETLLLGTNAISIVNVGNVPVLVVPSAATYHGINEIVLAVDFADTKHTLPLERIHTILELFKPKVNIVSVVENDSQDGVDVETKKTLLEKALSDYDINFSFVNETNFVDAINEVSIDKNVDMILVLPHKHSFISSLFKEHTTEKLVHHTTVPVLAVHD